MKQTRTRYPLLVRLAALSFLAGILPACGANAENWAHWRGPFFNGSSTETNLPTEWSKTNGLAWSIDLPGTSAATPIICADRVFVSSTDANARTLQALAVDRRTGQTLWQHKVADGIGRDRLSNFASPSPVTDGSLVLFFYGNGELAAFNNAGQRLWGRNLQTEFGDFAFQFTFAASPTLYEGRLYMQVLQRNEPVNGRGRRDGPIESFLLAVDPATGKDLWRHVRPSEARAESFEAYTTPIPFEHKARKEIVLAGGDCLTGHAPDTGKELWRWETWNPGRIGHWRLVPSPAVGSGVILACAPKREPVYAIKAGGNGHLGDAGLAWKTDQQREVTSDVPTPLYYLGDFFVLSDLRRNLSRVDPATGNVKWTVETPGNAKYEASPTGADGKVYLMSFSGDVVVIDAQSGRVLRVNPMGDSGDNFTRSTVAVAHGQLFIRTNSKLYCVAARH